MNETMNKIFIIIFGIVFLCVGVYILISGNELAKKCTVETVGTVVGNKEEASESYDGEYTSTTYSYYPIIEYKVKDETIKGEGTTGSNPPKYNAGDTLDILYNPNNVREFMIKGDKSSNIFGIVFIVAGALITVLGIFSKNVKFGNNVGE